MLSWRTARTTRCCRLTAAAGGSCRSSAAPDTTCSTGNSTVPTPCRRRSPGRRWSGSGRPRRPRSGREPNAPSSGSPPPECPFRLNPGSSRWHSRRPGRRRRVDGSAMPEGVCPVAGRSTDRSEIQGFSRGQYVSGQVLGSRPKSLNQKPGPAPTARPAPGNGTGRHTGHLPRRQRVVAMHRTLAYPLLTPPPTPDRSLPKPAGEAFPIFARASRRTGRLERRAP